MKSIGISDDVYVDLLRVKHDFEKEAGEVLSYDKIIKKLIEKNGGENIGSCETD